MSGLADIKALHARIGELNDEMTAIFKQIKRDARADGNVDALHARFNAIPDEIAALNAEIQRIAACEHGPSN